MHRSCPQRSLVWKLFWRGLVSFWPTVRRVPGRKTGTRAPGRKIDNMNTLLVLDNKYCKWNCSVWYLKTKSFLSMKFRQIKPTNDKLVIHVHSSMCEEFKSHAWQNDEFPAKRCVCLHRSSRQWHPTKHKRLCD